MSTDDTAAGGSAQALDPELEALIPSGSEIYDSFMAFIEPELLSVNLPSLAEKYKGESEEERKTRMERYRKAFAAYDRAYEKWITGLRDAVKQKRSEAYRAAEEKENKEQTSALQDLEAQFETAKPSPK
ncbi:hypothetical protein A2454_02055 [Candidatus Peribacteria bacterium RIFOXYC2_FULL_55_14]|nr:MAG: hypothetical protein UY85_C0078G0002 [Candidatus Peribacteria bacterium GW2011_GWB1_54_5]KKW44622.1 MAG: hypothetical protein UY90_C0006G0011 [Candidatus Peregrinibacteria bacterium GW2011_GWA2_54_9]OGJ72456.1 MAG: hypothetical protein A2198_06685 [Candidatus Peribacteria bacterium RIFOXYA1_FULL_56_14]OGJ73505.1 MAG: hypothetical protein A2217_02240 [Candidatus Peribacteria bacterium RIFOXYA2_FULL_55_28]OGJ74686.1 MAG: hypothetical protein A2384_03525 [Candidatus Peribacteria bacterium 